MAVFTRNKDVYKGERPRWKGGEEMGKEKGEGRIKERRGNYGGKCCGVQKKFLK